MIQVCESSWRASLCGMAVAAAVSTPAWCADESPWAEDIRSASRLIAATASKNATELRAAVEIRLDPGWHTYWRYPGDAGVPPVFNFINSENVQTVKVLYPMPQTFDEESGTVLGYADAVVFPLRIKPRDPTRPTRIVLQLNYAVCDKLCVPVEGHLDLTLPASNTGYDKMIAAAEARVPKEVPEREAGLTARRVNGGAKPLVAVDVTAAEGENVEVFVEGPTAEWALPLPKPAPGAEKGHREFGFELDGLPPGANPNGPLNLTFTVVRGARAIETTIHLD